MDLLLNNLSLVIPGNTKGLYMKISKFILLTASVLALATSSVYADSAKSDAQYKSDVKPPKFNRDPWEAKHSKHAHPTTYSTNGCKNGLYNKKNIFCRKSNESNIDDES
ncbi:MAG: hypothetical protein QM500_04950 [Methylococcales bacterium]